MAAPYRERRSDSPFVHQFAWGYAESDGISMLPADSHWHLFLKREKGKAMLAVGGPMTKVAYVPHVADTECFRMWFTQGAFMPHLRTGTLVDNVLFLPEASGKSFWLNSSVWEFPNFDNAESFVNRLVREGLLVRDPVINSVLLDQPQELSFSTVRRHFQRATGVRPGTIRQIERAHYAAALLRQGMPILDTVHEAGYFDQPHLTRSLKHFIGQTPAQLLRRMQAE